MDSDGSGDSDVGERQSIIIDMSMNTPLKETKEVNLDETMPFITTSGFGENDTVWEGSFGQESISAAEKDKEYQDFMSIVNQRWFELENLAIFSQVEKKEKYVSSGPCHITKLTSDLKNW
jgi:hypothetical protein